MSNKLIDLIDISKSYGMQTVLDELNLYIRENEFLTLLGPSGCGKTTTLRILGGFETPDKGRVIFDGQDITNLPPNKRQLNTVFQKYALFTHMNIADNIAFGLKIKNKSKQYIYDKIKYALKLVNLDGFEKRMPDSLSGGQQQRIAIARALILNPEYIVCDEPVSALDVSVHAQILNLLMEMQEKTQTTYLFISHNLAAVKKLCSRLAIMYLGKVVEYGDAAKIFANPVHPYTKALLSAVLTVNPNEETKRIVLKGDVTSPINPPSGCRFCSRCYQAQADCADRECVLTEVEAEHFAACPVVTGLKTDIEQ